MVDGSYSQFKATKGRKADRDFKKERFDKKKAQFNLSDRKSDLNGSKYTDNDQIESTKNRMRQRIASDKRKGLLIILITLTILSLITILIMK